MTRRGVVHTLDVFLAAVIIVTTLLFASQIPRERDYLEEMDLFATELRDRVGQRFDELDQLVHDQDQIIDRLSNEWIDIWLDDGCRGYDVVEDFIHSEQELQKLIPSDRYNKLRDIVNRIVDILR